MRLFIISLIAILFALAFTSVQAKNEYLGQNWRDCYAGDITPYVEYRKGGMEYIDRGSSSHEDHEYRVGVNFRLNLEIPAIQNLKNSKRKDTNLGIN